MERTYYRGPGINNNKNIFTRSKDYTLEIILAIYSFFSLFFKTLIFSPNQVNNSSRNSGGGNGGQSGFGSSKPPENRFGNSFKIAGMGGG